MLMKSTRYECICYRLSPTNMDEQEVEEKNHLNYCH